MRINHESKLIIDECVKESHKGTISFGAVVERLMAIDVESYHADYRRCETTYYLASGETYITELTPLEVAIADSFDVQKIQQAVRSAQQGEIRYPEFMRQTMIGGCVGYFVWISGRHVQYLGRYGETHIEHFPIKDNN